MEFCQICLEKVSIELIYTISCGCRACIECCRNWAISQINDEKTYIKCPFPTCSLMLSNLDEFLSYDMIAKLFENQVNLYLKLNKTIKKCPQKDCGYAGFIKKENQHDFFCERCNMCWEEPIEPIGSNIFKVKGYVEEGFNIIWKALFCKTCSGCEIFIEKNQGCRHIDCTMCGTDFCWFCKQSYKTHQQKQCSSTLSQKVFTWIMIISILMVAFKIFYCFAWIFIVCYWIVYVPLAALYIFFIRIFCGVILYNLLRLLFTLVYLIIPTKLIFWIGTSIYALLEQGFLSIL